MLELYSVSIGPFIIVIRHLLQIGYISPVIILYLCCNLEPHQARIIFWWRFNYRIKMPPKLKEIIKKKKKKKKKKKIRAVTKGTTLVVVGNHNYSGLLRNLEDSSASFFCATGFGKERIYNYFRFVLASFCC